MVVKECFRHMQVQQYGEVTYTYHWARNFGANEMLYTYTSGAWQRLINLRGPTQYNASFINDSKIDDSYNKMMDIFGIDENRLAQIHAELMPYVLEQCYVWFKPNAYSYVVWWEYRKNYNGELSIGYYNLYHYIKYNWIDEALKREITR